MKSSLLALTLMVCVLSRGDAQGYIDPGTGSYLFQLATAGIFGALYAAKVFWIDIRGFLTRRRGSGGAGPSSEGALVEPQAAGTSGNPWDGA